ncbi:carbohydrate binding family 9 domain-containing protein [Saccharobesus litoralis]|uniref:carbohydrate binding family 9 domain-containing protein n=1 Tax=Saccharobesus litoralis TaxID=2172099 RepID=UPI00131EE58D|nr:carbohydrate binding family 9 domain-containing protein [Saccharobesus litoralis]
MSRKAVLACVLLCLGWIKVAYAAQGTAVNSIPYLPSSIEIDGQLSESSWQQALLVDVDVVTYPTDNTQAQVRTQAFIFQNGQSLFVGVKAQDFNPELIRAEYKRRDSIGNDDHVTITLDTFNQQQQAFQFSLNPYGVQWDRLRDETRGRTNGAWNAVWQGAGYKHQQGYDVEFAIPFSALRFSSSKNSDLEWGIEITRIMPRDSRININSQAKERGNTCFLCQIPKYRGFKDITPGSDIELVPSITAKKVQTREVTDADPTVMASWPDTSIETDLSLSMRWGITQDNILNVALNPDFSQASADAEQITVNSSFSPTYRENRDFFLDGSDYFSTSRMSLVHTRNLVAPDYGVKFTGKQGNSNYGVLLANDTSSQFIVPRSQGSWQANLKDESDNEVASNNLVARYQHNLDQRSNMGVLMTQRENDTGYKNSVVSLDGVYQPVNEHRFKYQYAYSRSDNTLAFRKTKLEKEGKPLLSPEGHKPPQGQQPPKPNDPLAHIPVEQNGDAINLEYKYLQTNYDLVGRYIDYDTDFRADLSSIGKVGYDRVLFGGGRWWFGKKGSPWTRWGIHGDWDRTKEKQTGIELENEYEAHVWVDGPKQLHAKAGVISKDAYWDGEVFALTYLNLYGRIDPIKNIRVWTRWTLGDAIDVKNTRPADRTKMEFGSNWRLGEHITGSTKYTREVLDVELGELYDVNKLDFRLNVQFNLDNSLRLVVTQSDLTRNIDLYNEEVDDLNKRISTQLIYAYEPDPKTVFYLGYADKAEQKEQRIDIEQDQRSVFMKISYDFQI